MGVSDDRDLDPHPGSPSGARPPVRPGGGALRRSPLLGVVIFVGGAIGTSVRSLLEQAAPARPGEVPWTTLVINVVGSFLLGLLLESLTRTGPDEGNRRVARLGLGTGVLGGFTTYSTFAVETVDRLGLQSLVVGLSYAVGSVVLGVAAAAVGYRLARRVFGHGAGEPTR
ncbi:CrcB family protein [Terrabacter carboxydivorans]|uniref:Fluoride-specific ion channel FluC n=1 Tax=Terrabacter carboxydivorans TaxID=619730 RepID=A0ABN3LB06_9MICO